VLNWNLNTKYINNNICLGGRTSFNKGIALANLWKYKEAIECYEKALNIDPDYEEVWFYKELALRNLKRSDEK